MQNNRGQGFFGPLGTVYIISTSKSAEARLNKQKEQNCMITYAKCYDNAIRLESNHIIVVWFWPRVGGRAEGEMTTAQKGRNKIYVWY